MRLVPWRMMVGSSVPSALMRRSMTSRATAIAWSIAWSRPAWVWRMTIRLPSTARRPSRARRRSRPAGLAVGARQVGAASTWAGSRTRKLSWPPLVETSPIAIRGAAHLAAHQLLHRLEPLPGDVAGLRLEQQLAAAGEVEAEIDVHRLRPAGQMATALAGSKLGTASSTPNRQSRLMPQTFQRGKFSMSASVVRRLGAVRADVAQHRLDHPDADALARSRARPHSRRPW